MNILNSCLPNSLRTGIQLGEEEDEQQGRSSVFSCCLPLSQGQIRLPNERNTFENYLDPRSPVSIEDLLAEQEQELDNYYDQTDNEDLFLHTNTPKRTSFTFPQQQLMNNIPASSSSTNDNFVIEEAEDAQFISNHRISAIIVDESKLSHAHLNGSMGNDLEVDTFTQELVDVSTIPRSHRVFAIRSQDSDNEDDNENDSEEDNDDDEEEEYQNREQEGWGEENRYSEEERFYDDNNGAKLYNRYSVQDENTKRDSLKSTEIMMNGVSRPIASDEDDDLEELTVKTSTLSNTYSNYFPVATLTRVPYQPPPPMKSNINNNVENTPPLPQRRPSVVTTAQNILGDKLDDFTEKLAFIKKNIIMSMDSDDDQTEYSVESSHIDDQPPKFREKRPSWDALMPRFKRNTSTSSFIVSESTAMNRPIKKGFLPSPSSSKTFSRSDFDLDHQPTFNSDDEDEDEEPFDFSKVVAMGKNVRVFGGEVMGNGLRLFNNLSTRIKNTQQNDEY